MVVLELNTSQKTGLVLGGIFAVVVIVMSTMVFPFWNLIREDVFEEVLILLIISVSFFLLQDINTVRSTKLAIRKCIFFITSTYFSDRKFIISMYCSFASSTDKWLI